MSTTHCEHAPDGVLPAENECAAVPEGQSVRQVHDQEGEAHQKVGGQRFPYSLSLCILQILLISVERQQRRLLEKTKGEPRN